MSLENKTSVLNKLSSDLDKSMFIAGIWSNAFDLGPCKTRVIANASGLPCRGELINGNGEIFNLTSAQYLKLTNNTFTTEQKETIGKIWSK